MLGSDEGTCGETKGSSPVVQAVNPGDDRTLRVVVLTSICVRVCVKAGTVVCVLKAHGEERLQMSRWCE